VEGREYLGSGQRREVQQKSGEELRCSLTAGPGSAASIIRSSRQVKRLTCSEERGWLVPA
jgi:hypothetical protein